MDPYTHRLEVQGRLNGPLTDRETEVMACLAKHRGSTMDVAGQMDLSYYTVRNVQQVVYAKLRVSTLVEAFHVMGWLVVPEEARSSAADRLSDRAPV